MVRAFLFMLNTRTLAVVGSVVRSTNDPAMMTAAVAAAATETLNNYRVNVNLATLIIK